MGVVFIIIKVTFITETQMNVLEKKILTNKNGRDSYGSHIVDGYPTNKGTKFYFTLNHLNNLDGERPTLSIKLVAPNQSCTFKEYSIVGSPANLRPVFCFGEPGSVLISSDHPFDI